MHEQIGLALIDVLLGMTLFGLIAVIAFQSMGIMRERAFLTQAVSDARQVGHAVAAKLTGPNVELDDIPTGVLDSAQLSTLGVNMTGGNTAQVHRVDAGHDVCVTNSGAYAWYRASIQAIKESGYISDGETCASTVTETPSAAGPPADDEPGEGTPWVFAYSASMHDITPRELGNLGTHTDYMTDLAFDVSVTTIPSVWVTGIWEDVNDADYNSQSMPIDLGGGMASMVYREDLDPVDASTFAGTVMVPLTTPRRDGTYRLQVTYQDPTWYSTPPERQEIRYFTIADGWLCEGETSCAPEVLEPTGPVTGVWDADLERWVLPGTYGPSAVVTSDPVAPTPLQSELVGDKMHVWIDPSMLTVMQQIFGSGHALSGYGSIHPNGVGADYQTINLVIP